MGVVGKARGRAGLYGDLDPIEQRVALMHIAEASMGQIALVTEKDVVAVGDILRRPRVRNYILRVTGMVVSEAEPLVKEFNERLKAVEGEMFDIEVGAARGLYNISEQLDVKTEEAIRASIGAGNIAGRVLDRCGHKGTTRVEAVREFRASDDTVERIAAALEARQVSAGDMGHGVLSDVAQKKLAGGETEEDWELA